MNSRCARVGAFLLGYCLLPMVARAVTLDFESAAVGTRYGGDFGNTPGEVVLTSPDGIRMSVEDFHITAQSFTDFYKAEVGGGSASGFPTLALDLNNISAKFDFTLLGFNATQVSLELIELGGLNNFSINDGDLIEIAPLTSLPSSVNGVSLALQELDPVTGLTRLTLTGPDIDSVLIGGQELGIDNITVVPEPATILLLGLCAGFIAWWGSRRLTRPTRVGS